MFSDLRKINQNKNTNNKNYQISNEEKHEEEKYQSVTSKVFGSLTGFYNSYAKGETKQDKTIKAQDLNPVSE